MTQEEKSKKVMQAEEKVRQAKAMLARAKREEKKQIRREQNHHKFMMGGCVQKYFPEQYDCFEFSEQEMNRIIACAFSLKDVQNMIVTVIMDRNLGEAEPDEPERTIEEAYTDEFESFEQHDAGNDKA